MADDERRAEIEALRPFVVGALREARAAISATPAATRENARALRLVDDALVRLDRVRDARGDDEAVRPVRMTDLCRCGHQIIAHSAADGCVYCDCDMRYIPPIRSPQGEDHEAGIEAARLKLPTAWRHDGTADEGEALTRVMVAAYLSRVMAARDGTVAVEALRAIRTFAGEGPHTRMGEACGFDACIGCLIYATADDALAEFARPATGEQTDHTTAEGELEGELRDDLPGEQTDHGGNQDDERRR